MPKVYLINTNKTNNPQNEADMLSEGKAAVYYSPWKYMINEMEANDLVFLYSNGKGIIARGTATGIVEKGDIGDEENAEHYMYLNRFEELDEPLSSADITDLAQTVTDDQYKITWNRTMIHLPYFIGLEIWQHITKNGMVKDRETAVVKK